ncbi:MAG: hypothetical protein PHW92_10385 [Lutibacter sp.]|nr:hypothetical protein [Lutibacter sp.]
MFNIRRTKIYIRILSYLKKRKEKSIVRILLNNAERSFIEKAPVPFSLVNVKPKGFLVKTSGLYAYIPFTNMPWKYQYSHIWDKVFPYLEGKIFFGTIEKFERGKRSTIILNSVENQFRNYELEENKSYKAIVIVKTNYGVFVELGYGLRWNCGSILGLVHCSSFESEEDFYFTVPGALIDIYYYGKKADGKLVLSKTPNFKEWASGELVSYVGKEAPVTVILDENNIPKYYLFGKIEAELQLYGSIYQKGQISLVKMMIKNFIDREVLTCTVLRVDSKKKKINIAFNNCEEIARVLARKSDAQIDLSIDQHATGSGHGAKIETLVDDEIRDKLRILNKSIVVEVVKKIDSFGRAKNAFLIDNKYFGRINIVCKNYRITESEKKKIRNNLPAGFFIEADVKSFDKRKMMVTWTISEEEYVKLLKD